jgi:hypothetical protein
MLLPFALHDDLLTLAEGLGATLVADDEDFDGTGVAVGRDGGAVGAE